MNIAIIDDHAVVAQSLAVSLDSHLEASIIAVDLNNADFGLLSKSDIILLDFDLGKWGDAYKVLGLLAQEHEAMARILVFSSYSTKRVLMTCYHPLVKGYIHKSQDITQFVEAINAIAKGKRWYQKEVKQNVREVLDLPKTAILTEREIELARLHSQGYSRDEIAIKLSISRHTVNNHFSKMFQKLEIDTAREL